MSHNSFDRVERLTDAESEAYIASAPGSQRARLREVHGRSGLLRVTTYTKAREEIHPSIGARQ